MKLLATKLSQNHAMKPIYPKYLIDSDMMGMSYYSPTCMDGGIDRNNGVL